MNVKIAALAACMALTAAPAAAVTVVGATLVRVTNALPDWLQVAELRVFDFAAINVALGGTAVGSSIYDATSTPGKAIDGNNGGNYYTDTIFHSGSPGGGEFLEVSFAATTLSSLSINGRSDCCSERDLYNVEIFNAAGTLLYSGQLDARFGDHYAGVNFDAPTGGVPEPASWAMLIAGFGLTGGALRARRRATITA